MCCGAERSLRSIIVWVILPVRTHKKDWTHRKDWTRHLGSKMLGWSAHPYLSETESTTQSESHDYPHSSVYPYHMYLCLHSNNTGLFSVPVVVFNTTSSVYNSLYIMTLIFIFAFVIFLTIKKCFLHICSGMARTLEMCGKYMNLFLTLKALISYRFAGKFFFIITNLFLGIFRHFNYVKSLCVSARNIYFVSSKRQAREQSI